MEITKKGQAVLHCLQQNHAHMTAEDVAEALKKENIAISAATIYRQLEKLELYLCELLHHYIWLFWCQMEMEKFV